MATIKDHLTCSCCSKIMTKPYSLQCRHSLCHKCCLKTKASNDITCPRCQHKTEVSKIQEDNIRKELLDIFYLEVPSQFNLETDFKNILDQAMQINIDNNVDDTQQGLIHRYTAYLKLFENFTSTLQNRLDLLSELESLLKREITSGVLPRVTVWLDSHAHYASSGTKEITGTKQDPKDAAEEPKKYLRDMNIQPSTSSDEQETPATASGTEEITGTKHKMQDSKDAAEKTKEYFKDHLTGLADQVEAILLRKDGYMGLQCYEEHMLVLVDIYKDNVDELTTILKEELREKFKNLRIMEQDEKWAPSGDPVEICKLDTYVSQRGNVGTLAQVFVSSDSVMSESGWYVMTCKHVIGSTSTDQDDVHAIQIKDTVIKDPVIYSAMCPENTDQYSSEYFVDVALIKIDENTKTKLIQNNYIGKHLNCYCDKLGCNHVKIQSTVSKIGTKTNKTYGKILNLKARFVHFQKYPGLVCLVGDREKVFNEEGDSGALVVAEDIQRPHAIGLITSHIPRYRTLNRRTLKQETIHATCVVYLDSCIEALKAKFQEIKDIKIVSGDGQFLNKCN